MSPGSTIASASSAVSTPAVRSTGCEVRASIRSLMDCSISLSGQNPCTHSVRSAMRSEGMVALNASLSKSSAGSNTASMLSPSKLSAR